MAFLIMFIAAVVLGLCLVGGDKKEVFIGVVLAILYFPIGVILALTKKYK